MYLKEHGCCSWDKTLQVLLDSMLGAWSVQEILRSSSQVIMMIISKRVPVQVQTVSTGKSSSFHFFKVWTPFLHKCGGHLITNVPSSRPEALEHSYWLVQPYCSPFDDLIPRSIHDAGQLSLRVGSDKFLPRFPSWCLWVMLGVCGRCLM